MSNITPARKTILVVDDSKAISYLLKGQIEQEMDVNVLLADSIKSAREKVCNYAGDIDLALLDLNLPDGPKGEIVDVISSEYGIPSIVLTGSMSNELREIVVKNDIVDYVIKRNASEIDYVVNLARRIVTNADFKVLVVDDKASFRVYLRQLLKIHQYHVLEAEGGAEALDILQQNPDIRLVITDYIMPDIDGLELIYQIRATRSRSELAIIAVTSASDGELNAKMLKAGANDILGKPFEVEEFYCRVTQNADTVEYIERIRESATRDQLTQLHNRYYLFEMGNKLFGSARRGHLQITTAMLDLDNFKQINDKYGHLVGDRVLKQVAAVLADNLRDTDLLVRFGGEEFCVVAVNMDGPMIVFERIREAIEEGVFQIDDTRVNVSLSIGICNVMKNTLEEMINCADIALYSAKTAGRNTVVLYSDEHDNTVSIESQLLEPAL
ncbi:MAG: diguanylate cyclase [Gammaproteobacteria bacterium]